MDYLKMLDQATKELDLSPKIVGILRAFYLSYKQAVEANGHSTQTATPVAEQFLSYVIEQIQKPYLFEPFHASMREPIDYYRFGLDFFRPLVVVESSKILNPEQLDKIEAQLAKNENVVLLANHQIEPDPQAISLLLESKHPRLAEEMIFVAGHRVTSDPLSVPFSKGRNLLCIHSKKHMENPPEHKQEKLLHNKRTMKRMSELLSEGGKCIYVAPSGGRDRMDKSGKIAVAKFDPQSIEMFWLMAQKSGIPTHFYPMSLFTYDLLPPPDTVETELGEVRHVGCTPIHLAFGDEVDMEAFPGSENLDRKQKKAARAQYIWDIVNSNYKKIAP